MITLNNFLFNDFVKLKTNLTTKSLNLNFIINHPTPTSQKQKQFFQLIKKKYSTQYFNSLLIKLSKKIKAKILKKSTHSFQPMGDSFSWLISEKKLVFNNQLFHLDKSHIGVHTYYTWQPKNQCSFFRIDLDLSSCGLISPLETLSELITEIPSQIILIDYKERGENFALTNQTNKKSIAKKISLKKFIHVQILKDYFYCEKKIPQENTFFARLKKK